MEKSREGFPKDANKNITNKTSQTLIIQEISRKELKLSIVNGALYYDFIANLNYTESSTTCRKKLRQTNTGL